MRLQVIASTRFPVDAVRRFLAEDDREHWQHRLHVIGADLRDLKGLEAPATRCRSSCAGWTSSSTTRQTVRRPPQYYRPLLEAEQTVASNEQPHVQRWTAAHTSIARCCTRPPPPPPSMSRTARTEAPTEAQLGARAEAASGGLLPLPTARGAPLGGGGVAPSADSGGGGGVLPGMSLPVTAAVGQSAVLSQLAIVPGDEVRDDAAFPQGKTDGNSDLGQQLDLRAKNSWMPARGGVDARNG